MRDGDVEGFFVMGENPTVGSANSKLHRLAMANLKWLVVRDLQMIESATFWKDGPEVETGELRPEDIGAEIFFLPAATHTEKSGSFTNTQRLLQWHNKAVEPPADCRSETWFMVHLGRRIRAKLANSLDPRDRAILDLTWDYPEEPGSAIGEPDPEAVLREISGVEVASGKALGGYTELAGDGSTACGCWIYSGVYAGGVNQANRRTPGREQDWVAAEWAWAWPLNRRILYNRASADPDGRPWSERKRYVWWDADAGKWTGHDVPDFKVDMPPDYRPAEDATAENALRGDEPFVMQPDGKGWLYAPGGLSDGPLPAHYEPYESTVENAVYPRRRSNPTSETFPRDDNRYHPPASPVFPFALSTYRIAEHHTAGGMSRFLPHLAELAPELFVEVSPGLAVGRGLEHNGWATVVTERTAVEARVMVTDRMRPDTVGLPFHWGPNGLAKGDAANDLLPLVLDSNVHISEFKAATCDIRPGRRPRGPALLALVDGYRRRANP
jgi:formate dehydrogenase major subunit